MPDRLGKLDRLEFLKELVDLRSQLSATRATADASVPSAQSTQFQCLALLGEIDEKNSSLKEHEVRVNRLGEQLDLLQKDLQARESSQKQLKDDVLRMEYDILQAIAKAGASKDCELRKFLDEGRSKDHVYSLEAQNEGIGITVPQPRRSNSDSKQPPTSSKRKAMGTGASKLSYIWIEMGERRDNALKELRDLLATGWSSQ
ncbi:Nucleoprotein like [Actinidia chinensis var. chinensis]|uniref:Nucleoprotein like n=1 Tax=Actinidia chinensis var. chinensis TaxID=1590841 RepID=A0A2R6RFU9_ACTCC|nr:Nucleoprotein like [Actinidia chinensis var. chinensis]